MQQKINKGFSLVELSVSMAIIGIIASSAMSVALTSDYHTKKFETDAKLNVIEAALAGFVQLNYRLPCPANGATTITDANFGVEGTRTPGASGAACPNQNFNSSDIRGGVVPVTTLQLPDDFMFDGWGRRILYVVDFNYTNNETTNTNCASEANTICYINDPDNGSITVNDQSGSARTTKAIYLLMSHGENGHGAYIKNGSATRINAFPVGNPYRADSPAEMENAEFSNGGSPTAFDGTFVMKQFIQEDAADDSNREYFDDIIRYKTRSQTTYDAGYITYNTTCRNAANIIDNPGNNNCTGAKSEQNCENFATELSIRCIE